MFFQLLRKYCQDLPFTFISDEFNGVTTDSSGTVRPLIERTFTNFSQAEEENGQSRMYLGIHWSFDKSAGVTMGNQVADDVYQHLFNAI